MANTNDHASASILETYACLVLLQDEVLAVDVAVVEIMDVVLVDCVDVVLLEGMHVVLVEGENVVAVERMGVVVIEKVGVVMAVSMTVIGQGQRGVGGARLVAARR